MNLQLLNILVLTIVSLYVVYLYFFDCRQVGDERRELIRLKSLRVSQKVTCFIIIMISLSQFFDVRLSTQTLLAVLVFTICVSEICSKIYFEKKY